VAGLAPEVVLVAVGARRETPAIPGADRPEVLCGDDLRDLLTGFDAAKARKLGPRQRALLWAGRRLGVANRLELTRALSRCWMPVGKRVVLIGGGLVGVELADFLRDRGREVVVLEASDTLAAEMAPPRRWRVLHQLRGAGVKLRTRVRVESIGDEGVRFLDDDGASGVVAADSVILALGARADRSLLDGLRGRVPEAHAIGDCERVGYIQGALEDAARAARRI
jgi:2,4-dienoyl-CoA reductase (NADPH2)